MDPALQESCGEPAAHPVQQGDHRPAEESAVLHHAHEQVHPVLPPPLRQAVPRLRLRLHQAAGAAGGRATRAAGIQKDEVYSHLVFVYHSAYNLFITPLLQILGLGSRRFLTLTHRAQVKRFTQDLLKLLKFQASKKVAIKDFMQAYHWSVAAVCFLIFIFVIPFSYEFVFSSHCWFLIHLLIFFRQVLLQRLEGRGLRRV